MNKYQIKNFYKFFEVSDDNLVSLKEDLTSAALAHNITGLLITATEGANGTIVGSEENLKNFISEMKKAFLSATQLQEVVLDFKSSESDFNPFVRFNVKIRSEICTSKLHPSVRGKNKHLSPSEWQYVLENEKDFVLIDTRNWYETKLGKFKGAIDPNLDNFKEFPDYVEGAGIPKDKKILMYCTGGIRCEKASLELNQLGYENVYQLEGGILRYFEEFPNSNFEGECFVFDGRVSVDQNLQASKNWTLCWSCGQPGNLKIDCGYCKKPAVICEQCRSGHEVGACSKNCQYHLVQGRELKPSKKNHYFGGKKHFNANLIKSEFY